MSMGFRVPGPRALGVIPWCPDGSKGGNAVGFFGPMPGLSLLGGIPCPFYGMDQILVVERYIYF